VNGGQEAHLSGGEAAVHATGDEAPFRLRSVQRRFLDRRGGGAYALLVLVWGEVRLEGRPAGRPSRRRRALHGGCRRGRLAVAV